MTQKFGQPYYEYGFIEEQMTLKSLLLAYSSYIKHADLGESPEDFMTRVTFKNRPCEWKSISPGDNCINPFRCMHVL